MPLCASQWPFLWSFYLPLPCPPCALVNVRRSRGMDGCVNPVGDVRAANSSGRISRICDTYGFFITRDLIANRKITASPVSALHWWQMADAEPTEQTHIQMERKELRKGGSETIVAVLKEAVTLSKQPCMTSSSALYQCIHGNWLFHPLKTAIVCADLSLRTENGGPLGAEVAHMQMMRLPTCRPNQHFFSRWGWTPPCTILNLPAARIIRSL